MAKNPVILVHGYSDEGASFQRWKDILRQNGYDAKIISYVTLTNEVTIKDIAEGFDRALRVEGGLNGNEPFDAIVHSTGMLVIRAWLTIYDARRRRLNRLIGLAPASFGSPLADVGRSFLGSIFKGNKETGPDFMEAGDEVLDALELGSGFTWDLAHRDLLVSQDHPDGFYGPNSDTPYVFIFCGTEPYSGLRGFVNKPGTDGTVRWAGCSLRTRKVVVDLTRDPARSKSERRLTVLRGANIDIPMIPARGLNHATILSEPTGELQKMVLDALSISDQGEFTAWHDAQNKIKEDGYSHLSGKSGSWTQFVVHGVDERGDPVRDFHLQVYIDGLDGSQQTEFEMDMHPYARDKSYRCYHVDLNKLLQAAPADLKDRLRIRVMASSGSKLVGYHGHGSERTDSDMRVINEEGKWDAQLTLAEFGEELQHLFRPFMTTLVELKLNREPMPLSVEMKNQVCWFEK